MKTINRLCALASIASLAYLVPLAGNAQPTTGGERAGIIVGAFITDRQSTTRLDSNDGSGTEINLEDDLGLESSTSVGRLGGYVWLGKRHRLDGAYFNMNRSSAFPIAATAHSSVEPSTPTPWWRRTAAGSD